MCNKCYHKRVCRQFLIELGQVGNYMQSVSVNITLNCDKSLKATFFAVYIDRNWHLVIRFVFRNLPVLYEN